MLVPKIVLEFRMLVLVIGGGGVNHVSTYHAPKVTGGWAAYHVVVIFVLLRISNLEVGKPLSIYFKCMYHGYYTLPKGVVMVVYAPVTDIKVDFLIWSVDIEGVRCLVI